MENQNQPRIIAAVRTETELGRALNSNIGIIFYLAPDLHTLGAFVKKAHECGKKIMIHLDLATGIGRDKSGIMFAKKIGVDGIITTRNSIVKIAKEYGVFTVQRFFIVDSHSVETTIETARSSMPDMIEIMPGTAPKVITKLKKELSMPIVAGGLIDTKEEVVHAIACGATAVSIGKPEFWSGKESL